MANLACLELHPHPVRADDLDHPDELRVDLDPVPGVEWPQIREVAARRARDARATSGSSAGRRPPARAASTSTCASSGAGRSTEVRRAALALAREVERRAPALATSKWWKEERHGVFLDYNQNAKDRTVAGAYSVRPTPDARVSAPLTWDEVDDCEPGDFTLATMPARFARDRRPRTRASIDAPCSLDALLELSARHETRGPGRRAVAAALPEAGGRAARASQPSRRRRTPKHPLDRDRPRARRRTTRSRGSSAGRRATPRRPRTSSRPTSSSTRCAGASAPGRASASTCSTCPSCGRRRSRSIPTTTCRTIGTASATAAARRAEDLRELVSGRDLELIVAAVGRSLGRVRQRAERRHHRGDQAAIMAGSLDAQSRRWRAPQRVPPAAWPPAAQRRPESAPRRQVTRGPRSGASHARRVRHPRPPPSTARRPAAGPTCAGPGTRHR